MNVKLIGNFVQHLEVELFPGEQFHAQKGALIYLEQGIEKEVLLMSGSQQQNGGIMGQIGSLIGAKLSGESIFQIRYTNKSGAPRKIALGGSYGLVPVKLNGETLICHRGAYVASNNAVQITARVSVAGIMGGMGFFLQKIMGQSTVFLECQGQPIVRELAYGETIEVDEDHIIGMQGMQEHQFQSAWSLTNFVGGEGLSMLRITGPGKVYLTPGKFTPGLI